MSYGRTKMDLIEARRRKFGVEEHHRMGEVGILHEDDHAELIEGDLFNNRTGEQRRFTADARWMSPTFSVERWLVASINQIVA